MVGRSREELSGLAESFAEDEVTDGLRARSHEVLQSHRANGVRLMIASAAVDLLVAPIARRLDIEDWVATDMAWTPDGRLADHFLSPNCYGAEKLRRVCAFYGGLKRDDTHVTMYSDSAADVDLLTFAHEGVAVNPSRKLRRRAPDLGLRIEDWNRLDK